MRNFTIFYLVFVLLSLSQTSNAQVVISTPSLGFSQACARPSFNTYNVTFSFSPESPFGVTNQFVIVLSDETGDFSNPVILPSTTEDIKTSSATISFSVPITIAGEAFKLRVRSTDPVATSSSSNAFSAYYKIQDTPFTINNLISTGLYCSGGSYLLTIDNPGSDINDSPLQYDSLTFNWYKDTSPTTSVFVSSGETLSVNQTGTYFAETNYGSCTSDSHSNKVTVSEASSSVSSEISSSLGNPYCSSQGATTLSAINGISYKWYKDGEEISDATEQMYVTNEGGTYLVDIDLGDCRTSASINLENTGFTSSIDVPERNMIDEGETVIATVTNDAINPEFKWYLNETIITSATGNSYEATQTGNYKVVVNQTSGCQTSTEFSFVVTEPFPSVVNIPNLISPNGDGINDTWIIPQDYVSGTNTEVTIISSQGKIVMQTNDYLNNWPENTIDFKNVNPVYYYIITTENNQTKKGSITVVK